MSRVGSSQGENPLQPPSHAPRRQWRGTWEERDGLLWSPLLASIGLVAGFTTRAQGSLAGSRLPLEEQARNRAALARTLGFDGVARTKQVHGREVVRRDAPDEPWPTADAMWTEHRGVLLGVGYGLVPLTAPGWTTKST